MSNSRDEFVLRIADTNLITAQRLGEVIGHAPEIEQDISLANIGLDHLERARALYAHLAECRGNAATEDDFAFSRSVPEFRNLCLAEYPNSDYAHLILRQYLLDLWHLKLFATLADSSHHLLRVQRQLWLDQSAYHHRYSCAWMQRLAGGTDESQSRMRVALAHLWPFVDEIVESDHIERDVQSQGIADLAELGSSWLEAARQALTDARLEVPVPKAGARPPSGKQGNHTEHLSQILHELQYMRRRYPNETW